VVGGIGGIENAGGTLRIEFIAQFLLEGGFHEIMAAFHNFMEKRRADRIDKMGGKDTADQQVDRIDFSRFFVLHGHTFVIKVVPEIGGVDPAVFDGGQQRFHGMDIVNGEQAGNSHFAGRRRNETGHPVIAVDQIRFDPRHDIVDDFTLEGQSDFDVVRSIMGIDGGRIKKSAVFRQMDPFVRHFITNAPEFTF
jgi:hypothetical protein